MELCGSNKTMCCGAIDSAVKLPSHSINQSLRGHNLRSGTGQHELDRLEIDYPATMLDPRAREILGRLRCSRSRANHSGRDGQPRLDKPLFGQFKALANFPQHVFPLEADLIELD